MSVQTHFALRAPTPLPIALLDLPGHTALHLIQFVLSGEHQIRFLSETAAPTLSPASCSPWKSPETCNNVQLWWWSCETYLTGECCILWAAFQTFCHCIEPYRNDASLRPEGVERAPATGKTSNFGVACKRQYILDTLHAYVMVSPSKDNAIGVHCKIFLQQPWQQPSIREPSVHYCCNQRWLNTP